MYNLKQKSVDFIKFFILLLPVGVLSTEITLLGLIKTVLVIVFFSAFMIVLKKNSNIKYLLSREFVVPDLIVLTYLGIKCYKRISFSSTIKNISIKIGIAEEVIPGVAVLAMSCIALFGVDMVFKVFADIFFSENTSGHTVVESQSIKFKEMVFLFISAVALMTICTKSSPLYPINNWVDPNCYMTMGKSILSGLVPYRDLFEQKGPLLYFIHTIAAMISYNSFLGVYFIEIISCFVFLIHVYKIFTIYLPENTIVFIPLVVTVFFTSHAFQYGDSVEELVLPLLTYGLYILLKSLNRYELPSDKEFFMIGITSACVLWMKYTILGFYIGWIIVPFIMAIKNKEVKHLFRKIVYIVWGVLVVSLPILIYFSANNAIDDLFITYFYNNMFLYGSVSGTLNDKLQFYGYTLNWIKESYIAALILNFLAVVWLSRKGNKYITYAFTCVVVIMFGLIYFGGQFYIYYSYVFSVTAIIGLVAVMDVIIKYAGNIKGIAAYTLSVIITIIICLRYSSNTDMLLMDKSLTTQYQIKEYIDNSGIENPTIMNYGFIDGGYYLVTETVPNLKYFTFNNIVLKEMEEQQIEYFEGGKTDFVVTIYPYDCFDKYKLAGIYRYPEGIDAPVTYLYEKI